MQRYVRFADMLRKMMTAYGMGGMATEEYLKGIKNNLNIGAQIIDGDIAGTPYKVLYGKLPDANGIDVTVRIYVRVENSMLCMVTCRAMDGYEDQMFKAFEDCISAYE